LRAQTMDAKRSRPSAEEGAVSGAVSGDAPRAAAAAAPPAPAPAPATPTTRSLLGSALQLHRRAFGGDDERREGVLVAARAPGRANIIGEHVDYAGGHVLPVALDAMESVSVLWAGVGDDDEDATHPAWRFASTDAERAPKVAELRAWGDRPDRADAWTAYLAGALAQYPEARRLRGAAAFASNVPLGGGLSSSAAFEVSFATALEAALTRLGLAPRPAYDARERALRCVEGDHAYVGVPCGVMDQMASSLARAGHALLVDCRDSTAEHVPLGWTRAGVRLLVFNTGVAHSHAGGEYASRVRSCDAAASALGLARARLCDAAPEDVDARVKPVDAVAHKRATHVVRENRRVLEAVAAARAADWARFGALMRASHESLRDLYEVSCPELDSCVECAAREREGDARVLGARMTGGGFGGCAIALVQGGSRADAERIAGRVKAAYDAEFHRAMRWWVLEDGGSGANEVAVE